MGLARVNRGQLVLVAAAVIAIALAPILFAYLQLGYHPDVDDEPDVVGEKATEFLDRSVHDAEAETAGEYEWSEREAMADAVRASLSDDVETLETSRLERGVVYDVSFNTTVAEMWRAEHCESGDGNAFGECLVDDGVVLQERADEAVLLAVGFDIEVVGSDSEAELTVVVEVGG